METNFKPWYYKQEVKFGSYVIYNPNSINKYVCEVCGEQEAITIVESVNTCKEQIGGENG